MSFGAGMGAGMSAGIGTGIAIGVSEGRRRACRQIRDYLQENALTIHDQTGAVVDTDTLLSGAVVDHSSPAMRGKLVFALLVLLGLATFGVLAFLIFF